MSRKKHRTRFSSSEMVGTDLSLTLCEPVWKKQPLLWCGGSSQVKLDGSSLRLYWHLFWVCIDFIIWLKWIVKIKRRLLFKLLHCSLRDPYTTYKYCLPFVLDLSIQPQQPRVTRQSVAISPPASAFSLLSAHWGTISPLLWVSASSPFMLCFHAGPPLPFSYVFFMPLPPLSPQLWLSAPPPPNRWSLLHCSAQATLNQSQGGSMAGVRRCRRRTGRFKTKRSDNTERKKSEEDWWQREKRESIWSFRCKTVKQEWHTTSVAFVLKIALLSVRSMQWYAHTKEMKTYNSPPALDSSWLAPLLQNIGRETERAWMTCGAAPPPQSAFVKTSSGQTEEPLVPAAEQNPPRYHSLTCFRQQDDVTLSLEVKLISY